MHVGIHVLHDTSSSASHIPATTGTLSVLLPSGKKTRKKRGSSGTNGADEEIRPVDGATPQEPEVQLNGADPQDSVGGSAA